ncbi:MAG: ATP-binding protein [Leptospiraceae bacterium]|nr:ATP-binding protein [Leptospiraceae bacterium]MCB1316197.1 ATP-binding protein [Leptospiraceae bacterium]MCB1322851.1 ATP-binding protein [Leptospiraceae bacterium]
MASADQLTTCLLELASAGCQGNLHDFQAWIKYAYSIETDVDALSEVAAELIRSGRLKQHPEIPSELIIAGEISFPERVSYQVSGDLKDSPIQMVRSRMETFLRYFGAGEADIMDLSIATTEAMENAVKYSDHKTIEVTYSLVGGQFDIKIVNRIGEIRLEQDIESGKYSGSTTLMRGMMVMVKLFDEVDIDIIDEKGLAIFTASRKLKVA